MSWITPNNNFWHALLALGLSIRIEVVTFASVNDPGGEIIQVQGVKVEENVFLLFFFCTRDDIQFAAVL